MAMAHPSMQPKASEEKTKKTASGQKAEMAKNSFDEFSFYCVLLEYPGILARASAFKGTLLLYLHNQLLARISSHLITMARRRRT